MATLHVLRVFTGATGTHGNPLGVFLDGGDVPETRRQAVARDLGFAEDEATGPASLTLADRLDREIEVHQGQGSVLYARALGDGRAEVGGRVVEDEVRAYRVPTG